MTGLDLHPARLFHVGVVAADIDQAMAEMSASLGFAWRGGRARSMELWLYGEPRTVEMRIAHSVQGPPHVELIQAVPDTPWVATPAQGTHHLCYWSDEPAAVCARLEGDPAIRRILGKPGSPSGYFQTSSGLIVEIIGPELHGSLSRWIAGEGMRA
jgi:hypothetical protein